MLAASGGSCADAAGRLTVSAAVSLKDAFEEIGREFESRHAGVSVIFNFAGSGTLSRQIEAGAPVDIFASASARYMDGLEGKGLIVGSTRVDFARNSLVVVVPVSSRLRLDSLSGLLDGGVGRIAVGDPRTVPAGEYTEEALRSLGLWSRLRERLVFAGNARQVLDYVVRAEVDAAVVYATDAGARPGGVRVAARVPAERHKPVLYTAAVVEGTGARRLAEAFIALLVSEYGRERLRDCGFTPVGWEAP